MNKHLLWRRNWTQPRLENYNHSFSFSISLALELNLSLIKWNDRVFVSSYNCELLSSGINPTYPLPCLYQRCFSISLKTDANLQTNCFFYFSGKPEQQIPMSATMQNPDVSNWIPSCTPRFCSCTKKWRIKRGPRGFWPFCDSRGLLGRRMMKTPLDAARLFDFAPSPQLCILYHDVHNSPLVLPCKSWRWFRSLLRRFLPKNSTATRPSTGLCLVFQFQALYIPIVQVVSETPCQNFKSILRNVQKSLYGGPMERTPPGMIPRFPYHVFMQNFSYLPADKIFVSQSLTSTYS